MRVASRARRAPTRARRLDGRDIQWMPLEATWSARRVITPRARVERAHIATRRARTHAGEVVTSIEGARGTFERTRGCVCV